MVFAITGSCLLSNLFRITTNKTSKFRITGLLCGNVTRPHFYQIRSAWSMDQGTNKNHYPVKDFAPTVTKFCVMWEGQALPHDTKFGNCRDQIVGSRAFLSWSVIHGSSWSGLIKLGPVIPSLEGHWCCGKRFHVMLPSWTSERLSVLK